jgi:DNA-binding response OmpR family regulator
VLIDLGNDAMTAKKILLVDDSETILQMEQMILRQDRYELAVARNGKEGIAKALEFKPDLILMDVLMPGLDGFAALRQLRQHPHMSAVPIVMVTSKCELESMENGYESGCSDYIVKPIDGVELIAKVRNLLGE